MRLPHRDPLAPTGPRPRRPRPESAPTDHPRTRTALVVGTVVLGAGLLVSELVAGGLHPASTALAVGGLVLAGWALTWVPAWIGVAGVFMAATALPAEASAASTLLMFAALFDTTARRPAWRGAVVLGLGLAGLGITLALGIESALTVLAFGFVMLAVTAIAVQLRSVGERAELTARLAELRRTDERTQLARDMHDAVAAGMSHVVLLAADLRTRDHVPADIAGSLDLLAAEARRSLSDLRDVLTVLRDDPQAPDAAGALRREWDDGVRRLHEHGFAVESHYALDAEPSAAATRLTLRLAVRELLANVLRHAAPGGTVHLTLTRHHGHVNLLVTNELPAAPAARLPSSGLGLQGLLERTDPLGGHLVTQAVDGQWVALLRLSEEVAA